MVPGGAEGWLTTRLTLSTDPRKALEQIPALCVTLDEAGP